MAEFGFMRLKKKIPINTDIYDNRYRQIWVTAKSGGRLSLLSFFLSETKTLHTALSTSGDDLELKAHKQNTYFRTQNMCQYHSLALMRPT
jgi:hypothetical protein